MFSSTLISELLILLSFIDVEVVLHAYMLGVRRLDGAPSQGIPNWAVESEPSQDLGQKIQGRPYVHANRDGAVSYECATSSILHIALDDTIRE